MTVLLNILEPGGWNAFRALYAQREGDAEGDGTWGDRWPGGTQQPNYWDRRAVRVLHCACSTSGCCPICAEILFPLIADYGPPEAPRWIEALTVEGNGRRTHYVIRQNGDVEFYLGRGAAWKFPSEAAVHATKEIK